MSTYGRMWEERKDLRTQLQRLGVEIGEYAGLDQATSRAALVTLSPAVSATTAGEIKRVINRWREIERVMDACDSETGEP